MKELTKAEEQIMQELWTLEKAFVNDILARLPHPKPAYNTVSTVVRILERKGFVGYTAYGKSHQYYPLISKKEYSRKLFKNLAGNYFSNSVKQMFSFFSKEKHLSLQELKELRNMIDQEIENKSEKS